MNIKQSRFVVALAGTVALVGCTDPSNLSNADRGALIGAGAGAVAGQIIGRDSQATAIGAVLGGAIGAGVGYNLDQQEAELRRDIGGGDVDIVNTGDRLIVRMPQDLLFSTDSFVVRSDLRNDLYTVAESLRRYPQSNIQVIGHTDSDGEAGYNQTLSERRASSVSNILVDAGVPPSRLRAIGRGESQPVASNLNAAGKAQNRRVEIVILPTS